MKRWPDKKIAVFPGTFDPFTVGHMSLVERGLDLFDEIIIAIGINEAKHHCFTLDHRIEMLETLFRDNARIQVTAYNGLTVDAARQYNARFILRGIRSVADFEYEKTIADVNRQLSGIETVLLFTEPRYAHISSTIVRELIKYGQDVQQLLPAGMTLPQQNK
ncbi:MAG: pantetheine-phosphate adenylyltransferase [Coprobacter sp.]|nr:pantetheine-phosphate adenylyltransferase [Coprobacter sp.]